MQTITSNRRDFGTPELHKQHVVGQIENGDRRKISKVHSTCPIDFYYHQIIISPRQYDAANTLYRLWYYGAEKSAYVTVRNPTEPRGLANYESKVEMEEKYNAAMVAIKELPTRLIIYNVVCIGEWAKYIKISIGRDRRMKLLKEGLDALADHFKIPVDENGAGR